MAKLIFFYKLLFRRVQKMPYWHEYMYNHPRHYLGDKSSSGSYNGVCYFDAVKIGILQQSAVL